jgi:hypothetical protein
VIDDSDLHTEKHFDPRTSTFLGIMIDSSDDHANTLDLMRVNRESDSNVIDESDLHPEKHFDPRTSTFRGIMIDSSDDHANT